MAIINHIPNHCDSFHSTGIIVPPPPLLLLGLPLSIGGGTEGKKPQGEIGLVGRRPWGIYRENGGLGDMWHHLVAARLGMAAGGL